MKCPSQPLSKVVLSLDPLLPAERRSLCSPGVVRDTKMSEKNGEDIDRISDLPDSILLHILSFLPTKTSVSTMSLVSRRWRHLWEHLQAFDFWGGYYKDDDIKLVKRFAFFVNAVLTLRKSRDILKMHLNCGLMEQSEFSMIDFVEVWVSAAIGPRLEELHLMLPNMGENCFVALPHTLLNCSSLVSLSLSGPIDLNHLQFYPARIYFPSLKKLYVKGDSLDSIDSLLNGCPILETVDIIVEGVYDILSCPSFSVSPSLKRLEYSDIKDGISIFIDINAPCLEYLSFTTVGTLLDTTVGNLQNVVEAYINISLPDYTEFDDEIDVSESVEPLLNLLQGISRTKHLTLCSPTTEPPLLCALILDFPVFSCLLHLDLQLPCFNSKLLAKVLENCHVLQDFIIQSYEEVLLPLQISEPPSTIIPNCLVSHLTSIRIKGYYGCEDELTFVEYILRNALVLKTMIITSDHSSLDLKEKLCNLKKISNIPRGSNLCQVDFD